MTNGDMGALDMGKSLIDIQKIIVPDIVEIMQKRFRILQNIQFLQPVGRRSLSQNLNMTERVLRSEIDFLKSRNLVSVTNTGMSLTEEGKIILEDLEHIMKEFSGISILEMELTNKLGIKGCIIVPGNADESEWVKSELGKMGAEQLSKIVQPKQTISVTGGTTIASVAEALPENLKNKELLFVPARGGIGADLQYQANSLCQIMAKKTAGDYMVLYVPDQVTKELYHSFINDSSIREVLLKIKSSDVVIHGIGDAITMAKRRNTSQFEMDILLEQQAVAEAFGYYFDENGKEVNKVNTIGLQLEDLQYIPHIIAVAGGVSKAKAIKAYMKIAPKNTILVTDESAAKLILKG